MKPIPIRKDEAYNRASVQGVLVTLFRTITVLQYRVYWSHSSGILLYLTSVTMVSIKQCTVYNRAFIKTKVS